MIKWLVLFFLITLKGEGMIWSQIFS